MQAKRKKQQVGVRVSTESDDLRVVFHTHLWVTDSHSLSAMVVTAVRVQIRRPHSIHPNKYVTYTGTGSLSLTLTYTVVAANTSYQAVYSLRPLSVHVRAST